VEARDADRNIIWNYRGEPRLIVNSGLVLPRKLAGFQAGVWEGKVVVTDSGMLTLILVDEQTESRLDILVKEKPHKAKFPCAITCRCCGQVAQVRGMDIYRCRHCNEIVYVDAWAHLLTLKSGSRARRIKSRYKGMELKINGDVNYLNAIRRFINSLCEQENLDELTTNAVILTTEEALLNIIEHGNNFDPRQMLKIKLSFQKKQLTVQIRDYGDPHDVTQHQSVSIKSCIRKGMKGGVGGVLINKLMDRVTYRSYENYNQLNLVKRYPVAPGRRRKSGSSAEPAVTSFQSA
jgi:serine/threonine-protein kinase RsbW